MAGVTGRTTQAVLAVALLGASGEAAADAVIYDAESLAEVSTQIAVTGVEALGDVILVVYPYPCALSGALESLEKAAPDDPGATLERWPEPEDGPGYLVVREGVAFASASNYEGPYNRCYFFGLPRAQFPESDGEVARLEGLSDAAMWRVFSRDPAVLRTGVPLAMAGLAKIPKVPRSRLVTYAARLVDGQLRIEATEWAWTGAGGKVRREDPRKLSPARVYAVEPHAEPDDGDEEARWFAGALAQVVKETGPKGQDERASGPIDGDSPAAGASGPAAEVKPSEAATPAGAAPAGAPGTAAAVNASEAAADTGAAVVASPPTRVEGPRPTTRAPGWWDSRLWYGVICLVVALGAGLLLRRGR